jgi:hypothetical protein
VIRSRNSDPTHNTTSSTKRRTTHRKWDHRKNGMTKGRNRTTTIPVGPRVTRTRKARDSSEPSGLVFCFYTFVLSLLILCLQSVGTTRGRNEVREAKETARRSQRSRVATSGYQPPQGAPNDYGEPPRETPKRRWGAIIDDRNAQRRRAGLNGGPQRLTERHGVEDRTKPGSHHRLPTATGSANRLRGATSDDGAMTERPGEDG